MYASVRVRAARARASFAIMIVPHTLMAGLCLCLQFCEFRIVLLRSCTCVWSVRAFVCYFSRLYLAENNVVEVLFFELRFIDALGSEEGSGSMQEECVYVKTQFPNTAKCQYHWCV